MLKCTMLFEVTTNDGEEAKPHRQGGWSESHYSSEPTNFNARRLEFESLCRKRAALLPDGALIIGQRYQIVDPVGTSQSFARQFPGGAALAADYPTLAMYLRVPARDSRNISPLALRCMPDARIVKGEYSPSQAYQTALVNFLNGLNGSVWRFKGRDLAQTAYPVINILENGTFTLEGNSTLAAGDMVRVLRGNTEDGDQVGGRFRISSMVSASSGVLFAYNLGFLEGGAIRKDLTIYPPYGVMESPLPRIVSRKIGRPFTGFRGRVSKKK